MFGRAVFEVTDFKEGRMVKKKDFEAAKNQNELKKTKLRIFIYKMPYCHFHARNGSKTEKVNKVLVDFL